MCYFPSDLPMDDRSNPVWQTYKQEILSKLGVSDAQPEKYTWTLFGMNNEQFYFNGTASDGRKFFAQVVYRFGGGKSVEKFGFE